MLNKMQVISLRKICFNALSLVLCFHIWWNILYVACYHRITVIVIQLRFDFTWLYSSGSLKDSKRVYFLTEQSEHAERRCISFKVHIESKGRQKQNRWRPPQEIRSLLTELGLQWHCCWSEISPQGASAHTVEYKQYGANLLSNVPLVKKM